MKEFYKRPLCFCSAAFLLGAAIGGYLTSSVAVLISIIVSAVTFITSSVVLFMLRARKNHTNVTEHFLLRIKMSVAISCALFIGISLSFFTFFIRENSILQNYSGDGKKIEATVNTRRHFNNYSASYYITITNIDGKKVKINSLLDADYPLDFAPREKVILTASLSKYESYDDSLFSRCYARSKGLLFTASPDSESEYSIVGLSNSFSGRLDALRRKMSAGIKIRTSEEKAGMISALLIGDRSYLSEAAERDFRRLGLSHILAISGMHLSVIVSALTYILKKTRLSQMLRSSITIAVIILYTALTGFSMSVLRAALMLIMLTSANIFGRKSDPITSLFFSVSIICLLDIYAVCDVGLTLSFSATLGIISVGQGILKKIEYFSDIIFARMPLLPAMTIHYILSSLAVSISAVFFTIPFSCMWFEEFALLSPVSNIIFIPLFQLLMYIIPFVLLYPLLPSVASVAASVATLLSNIISSVANFIASKFAITVSLHYDFIPYVLIISVLIFVILIISKKIRKYAFAITALFSVISITVGITISTAATNIRTDICYFRSGINEFFIISDSEGTSVCDISDGTISSYMKAWNFIKNEFHQNDIDCFILTHYHNRQVTSLHSLSQKCYIRQLYLPVPITDTEYVIARALIEKAENNGIAVNFYSCISDIDNDSSENSATDEFEDKLLFENVTDKIAISAEFGCNKLMLCPREYLARSTHPTVSLILGTKSKNGDMLYITYFAASHKDNTYRNENFNTLAEESDITVYGLHSPKSTDKNYYGGAEEYSENNLYFRVYEDR